MDLITTFAALRRHWIATSLLLLVTLAACGAVVFVLPWTYQAQSTVVLLPSHQASKINGFNPYLSFDGAVTNTAYVVSVVVTGPSAKKALAAAGDTGSYTVTPNPNTSGPILDTTVTASTQANAESTLRAVTLAIGAKLRELQAADNITPANRIGFEIAAMSPTATRQTSKKAKTLGIALALGLFLTVSVPLGLESRAARRRAAEGGADPEKPQQKYDNRAAQPHERRSSEYSARVHEDDDYARRREAESAQQQEGRTTRAEARQMSPGPEESSRPADDQTALAGGGSPRSRQRRE